MSFSEMSQTRRRAWLVAVIWSVAGVGFVLTFFMGGGVGTFAEDSRRHLLGAAAIAFGFGGHALSMWLTRQRKGAPPLVDERDLQVAAQANQATLVVVLVVAFAFTITLWTVFESRGSVPVAWMWFLAYGEAILAFVTSAVITLIVDGRMTGHG